MNAPTADVPVRRRAQSWLTVVVLVAIAGATAAAFVDARDDATTSGDPDRSWMILVGGAALGLAVIALATVARRHQRALSNVNRDLLDRQRRSRAVEEVSGQLARALSGDDVRTALLADLPGAVGGVTAVVAICDDDGRLQVVRAVGPPGPGDDVLDAPPDGSPVHAAVADGVAAWLRSPLDWRGDDATDVLAGEAMALALLPLHADDVRGVLAVGYGRVHVFLEEERTALETIGVLAALALARARRYDTEHRAAVAFQRAALPDALPDVAGLTIAARYRPAARHASVGGDWYDVLPLDDGRVVLVVGDVVGHGLEAAAAMGRLRTAFQTLAPLATDPSALVQVVGQQVASIPNSMCTTVLCAILEPDSGKLTWTRAGHVPPIVLTADGTRLLDEPGSPPLGVAPGAEVPQHVVELRAGERIVFVTDGVVERRGEPIDEGLERVQIVAEALVDLEPEEFVDALVEATVTVDEQFDDVVVLVVRRDG